MPQSTAIQCSNCRLSLLPRSVIATVVSLLDCHSVRALLIALECLHKLAIVVTDSQAKADKPVFFDIPGVNIVSLQSVLGVLDGVALFKLFEANMANVYTREWFVRFSAQSLDALSFVHYYEGLNHLYCHPESTLLQTLGDHGFKYSLSFQSPFYQHQVNPAMLIQLSISETLYVEELYFPCLLRLSINFYTNPNNTIPVVRNIVTPVLRSFSIHYSGRLPLIYNVDCSQDKRLIQAQGDFSSVFELCNTNGLDLKKCTLNNDTFQYFDYRKMNLSFTKIFSTQQYIGVPDYAFSMARLTLCRSLHWLRTVKYTHESAATLSPETEIKLPRTLNLLYQTSITCSFVPHFTAPQLITLNIFITAPGVFLNNIFEPTSIPLFQTLCSVNITCHLPSSLVGYSNTHTIFTKAQLRTLFALPLLKHLTIRGFLLGRDNCLLFEDEDEHALPMLNKFATPPQPLQKLVLEIVKLRIVYPWLKMRMLRSLYRPQLRLLKLSQDIRGERYEGVDIIIDDLHKQQGDSMKDLVVEIDDSFELSSVNGDLVDNDSDTASKVSSSTSSSAGYSWTRSWSDISQ